MSRYQVARVLPSSAVTVSRNSMTRTVIPGSGPVLEQMQNISVGQQWGLGIIPGASFKGGWGPGPPNGYLVRQFGVIDTPDGQAAIAIATEPSSGTLEAGTQILNRVAKLIQKHLTELPGGSC